MLMGFSMCTFHWLCQVARSVFQRAYDHLKKEELREERVLLLDAWRTLEKEKGDAKGLAEVEAKVPKKLKKKRMVTGDDGEELGWEEYYDYHFPDDVVKPSGLAILQRAQMWKQQMEAAAGGGGGKRKRDEEDDDGREETDGPEDNED